MSGANSLREWYSPAIYFLEDPDADCPKVDVPNTEEEKESEETK